MTRPDAKYLRWAATAIAVIVMVAGGWISALDTAATGQVDAGLKRALADLGASGLAGNQGP